MFINYDEQELINLFKAEPIHIFEKEVGMFIYSFSDIRGIKVMISVSIYEHKVTLRLGQKEETILELKLKNVESLVTENDGLRICQSNAEQDIMIYFTPKIFVKYLDN